MAFTAPDTWNRELINGEIIWTHRREIKCFACGKAEHALATIYEGKYNPDLEETIKHPDGSEQIVYPTLAPHQSRITWHMPEGWTQITHIDNKFYPNEILTAITVMGLNPFYAFEKWWSEVGTMFAECICESDDCWMEAARKIRLEYRTKRETVGQLNGKPI